jgi:mannose-6-phosphate isomerase-like protein (cupin superfamily)
MPAKKPDKPLQQKGPEDIPDPDKKEELQPASANAELTDMHVHTEVKTEPEPLLPLPIPQEVFDHNEAFARRRLPRIYHANDSASVVIIDPERYEIRDLSPRSTRDENKVVWTTVFAEIQPQCQLEPTIVDDGNIKYTVLRGSGSVTIENVSKPIERNNIFIVEKGITHSIINPSKLESLVILIDYSGNDILDLRDLYKPMEQMTKKAQISRERVMNIQPKKEEKSQVSQQTVKKKAVTEDLFV